MLRIFLFVLTNMAVMFLVSITFTVLGVEEILYSQGLNADLGMMLVFCAVFGMVGSLVSLLLSKSMAKRGMGVKIIEQPANAKEQWLVTTVEKIASDAGIKTPEIGVFPSQASNAFATGWNRNAALVAVSEGLLHRFTEEECKAVMAHEIGHVANGDMITLSLIQGIINTFVMFFARIVGLFVDRVILKNDRGYGMGFYLTSMLAQVVFGILGSIVVMWFSRWREYRADVAGAELASRSGMINALKRLQQESDIPKNMPEQFSAFGISGDLKSNFGHLFLSHPPLEQRIAALQAAAGPSTKM